MFTSLKSFGKYLASDPQKAASRRRPARLTVEQLEDRVLLNGGPFPPPPQGINPLSSPHIDLLNDHFLLNFAGHHAELTVTSEDLSPGKKTSQIGGVFIDPSTGVTGAWGGQLSLTNTTKNGYPVENLASFSPLGVGCVWEDRARSPRTSASSQARISSLPRSSAMWRMPSRVGSSVSLGWTCVCFMIQA
jgi:hypothetical protein